jgi:hypothetical protein
MASYPKAKGKQEVRAGSDCGAHEAFSKATSPASVKKMASGKTVYKHR